MSQVEPVRKNCRICNGQLFTDNLLCFSDMPAAAQNFPDQDTVVDDSGADLFVAQCRDCGLIQLRNAPVWYYRDVIRAAAYSEEMKAFRMEQFAAFFARHQLLGEKLLEVGCGRGEYLSLINAAGASGVGIEHLESSVEECHQQGLVVEQGYPDTADAIMKNGPFRGFFILNFFEHLPDPITALRFIANNLSDDGIGLIEVPDFDTIVSKNLFSEFINDHLFYFTEKTLRATLERAGFEVIECRSIWHDYILSATVKKRSPENLSPMEQFGEQITQQIRDYLGQHKDAKRAVWGAGHQALAVLSMAQLGDLVDLVLDSAPFKQGRLTPASHIRIVSPEVIADEGINLVIVMAASYSDEVARLIDKLYPASDLGTQHQLQHVAVLKDHGLEVIR